MSAETVSAKDGAAAGVESAQAWLRLVVAVLISTLGGVGMWSVVVALPTVQSDFGVARADASLPYTLTMLGFGVGGIAVGRAIDRWGALLPMAASIVLLGLGYVLAGNAATLWQFALAQGLLVGVGSGATFGPLLADISHWFTRNRGIAVALCASGSYFAGALWPPILQHFIATSGWRATHVAVGLFCMATMLPLALGLRRAAPSHALSPAESIGFRPSGIDLAPRTLQIALVIAGLGCCVAMSMPQVHIVAYCGDLGYGVARGAQMLSLMLGFGIVSRIASGFIADRLGGFATLLLGSALQGVALLLYLLFSGLGSLFVISALFGLFQGGIVPSYAIITREFFPPGEAGARVGIVLFATLVGMALGGWMSGALFDLTGSYRAAFANGVLWNLLNGSIVLWLLWRQRRAALARGAQEKRPRSGAAKFREETP